MSLLIHCPTDHAVLLVGVDAGAPPLRFLGADGTPPGCVIRVDAAISLNEQFLAAVATESGHAVRGKDLDVEQRFHAAVVLPDGEQATLYVAKWNCPAIQPASNWLTMPEILRNMPKDRNRLGYVKAWQVLSGALTESTKAVDIRDILDLKDP